MARNQSSSKQVRVKQRGTSVQVRARKQIRVTPATAGQPTSYSQWPLPGEEEMV